MQKMKISNIEQGMSNNEALGQRKNFIIRYSMLDIRYSFRKHGKSIILKLSTEYGKSHTDGLMIICVDVSLSMQVPRVATLQCYL
jgi:hypothetical protein